MGLFILILILILALTGALTFVLKVALGVALGLFLAVVLIASLIGWRIRRALLGPRKDWRRVRGSRIEVLRRGDEDT
jgi:membrane protein implicated in regulation of membrane protease activity